MIFQSPSNKGYVIALVYYTHSIFLAVCLLQCRVFTFASIGTSRENVSIFSIQLFESIKTWVSIVYMKCYSFLAELLGMQITCSEAPQVRKIWLSMHPRDFGGDLQSCGRTRVHLSAPLAYQCKLTQSMGMATRGFQTGNRMATRVLWSRDNY